MNKETKIAEKNVENLFKSEGMRMYQKVCKEHKQTCQRWLEFLEEMYFDKLCIGVSGRWLGLYKDKQRDLKQAIKLYEENGI